MSRQRTERRGSHSPCHSRNRSKAAYRRAGWQRVRCETGSWVNPDPFPGFIRYTRRPASIGSVPGFAASFPRRGDG